MQILYKTNQIFVSKYSVQTAKYFLIPVRLAIVKIFI